MPHSWLSAAWFYYAVDALVLVAIARDLILQRRVHPVFAVALPPMAVGQVITVTFWQHPPAAWMAFCGAVVGVG